MAYGSELGPIALAHRGGASLAPENTIAAFGMATALGIRYLETDVRITADGELACFHDATLGRVTDGRGPVARHTLAQLRRLRVLEREPIPTLTEALEAFPDARFTVDLKERSAIGALTKVLQHKDFRERVCIAGAWDGCLDVVRAQVPGVRTALGWRALAAVVTCARAGMPPARRFATAEFLHVPDRLGRVQVFVERLVTGAHGIGVKVVVWTVNDRPSMVRLLDAGVDGIITDRPDLLREVLLARGEWAAMPVPPGASVARGSLAS
jgi:glycerophosphoryl diester phosphodiesterase